ncbi:hypothetical protein [Pseudomonas yamanorum]
MTNDDIDLLEFAGKAAGVKVVWTQAGVPRDGVFDQSWNPLEDDGDALRLVVKLGMNIVSGVVSCRVAHLQDVIVERYPVDGTSRLPSMATAMPAIRRAIVNVAAQIGKNMPA